MELNENRTESFEENINAGKFGERAYLNEKFADIYFIFENERVPVHKQLLAYASPVFEKMFYGSLRERDEVTINDASSEAFKEFLQFIYLKKVTLTIENIAEVMNLVKKYGLDDCLDICASFLKKNMEQEVLCTVLRLALLFEHDDLIHYCDYQISLHVSDILKTEHFLYCEWDLLNHIVQLNVLAIYEMDLFDACILWAKKSCDRNGLDATLLNNLRSQLKDSVREIRWRQMNPEDAFKRLKEFGEIFTKRELLEITLVMISNEYESEILNTSPRYYFASTEKWFISHKT